MSKQDIIISCECGHNCNTDLTVSEDNINSKLTKLSSRDRAKELPDFFVLDRNGALELVQWLVSKYKLRDEIAVSGNGNSSKNKASDVVRSSVATKVVVPDSGGLVEIDEEIMEEVVEDFEFQLTNPTVETVKKKRGRPKKNA